MPRNAGAVPGRSEIAEDFWIVPSWAQAPAPDALNLRLDPGLAFGTGSHPTTRLCLGNGCACTSRAGESLLDYGCGSGILAIAGARLGAGRVVGTDVDHLAMRASEDQCACEWGRGERSCCPTRSCREPSTSLCANILANPLDAARAGASHCASGRVARIALSGILDQQADAVAASYAPWFTIARWKVRDEWVLLGGRTSVT